MYLGNLSVRQIEERLCVEFDTEIKDFLDSTHQQNATLKNNMEWHCFDIPFMLSCGSMEMAVKVNGLLKPIANKFKRQIQIGIDGKRE